MKLCKDYTKEPFSFLVNDTTLSSDNPLRFRNNLNEITKILLMTKSKQSIIKSSKEKLNLIYKDKLLGFQLYYKKIFINMNFWPAKMFYHKTIC